MSLFGKILIVLNTLLLGGFFYVAAIDYARRQAWADNYLQHELVINGLPWDDKELDARGAPRVESIRKPVLAKMQGGTPVTTQEAEFNAHKTKLNGLIEETKQAGLPKAKAKQLVNVLTSLADSQARREQLRKLAAFIDQAPDDKPYDAWFQVTAQTIAALKALKPDPIPEATVAKLEKIKDQPPVADADFNVELSKALPDDEVKQFRDRIAELADLRTAFAAEVKEKFDRVLAVPAKPDTPDQTVQTLLDHRKLQFADLHFRLVEANRGYKLTDESFVGLGRDGMPAGVVAKLATVKDRAFDTEDALIQELSQALTPEELKLHRVKILSRGRDKVMDSKAYERFLAVTGLANAWRAVDHAATNLRQGEAEVNARIESEREIFVRKYRERLIDIANLKDQIAALKTIETDGDTLIAGRAQVVKDQTIKRNDLIAMLKEKQEKTAELLKTQKFLEDSLFKSRQELRDAFSENQKLEQTLRTYEQGR